MIKAWPTSMHQFINWFWFLGIRAKGHVVVASRIALQRRGVGVNIPGVIEVGVLIKSSRDLEGAAGVDTDVGSGDDNSC